MKKSILIFSTLLFATMIYAQDAADVFKGQSIVWFGLDFSQAHFTGVNDEKPDVIQSQYLELWNQPMIYERDKYPLPSIFHKPTVHYDLGVVKDINKKISADQLFKNDGSVITTSTIEEEISRYPIGEQKTGLGVVFLVESFNKKKKEAVAYVVFFDIASHKVLLAKRLTGEAGGGGLKNYWANAFAQMMTNISEKLWPLWQKEADNVK